MRRRSSRTVLAAAVLLASCASPSVTPSTSSAPPSEAESTPVATPTPTIPTVPAWRELTPSGDTPAAREDHTWTATPDAATAYLFGGRTSDGVALGDLWAYDLPGNSWTLVTEDGPAARFGHNAAWVDGVGLVIFAGQAGATFYNDLWAFDPAADAWTELAAGGAVPVPRYGSCAAIGPDGRLWISHGFTQEGQRFADTRAYDFSTSQWTDETPAGDAPIQRCLHACWWTENGLFALYAGQTTGTNSLGDLWWLMVGERPGTNNWAEVELGNDPPPARNLYAAARLDGATGIFGGQALDGSALNDMWWFNGGAELDATPGERPPGRWGAELILADADQNRLLLFGGRDEDAVFGDLWELFRGGRG